MNPINMKESAALSLLLLGFRTDKLKPLTGKTLTPARPGRVVRGPGWKHDQ